MTWRQRQCPDVEVFHPPQAVARHPGEELLVLALKSVVCSLALALVAATLALALRHFECALSLAPADVALALDARLAVCALALATAVTASALAVSIAEVHQPSMR